MWHSAAVIGAVLALASWIVLCLVAQPPRIEETLQIKAERALAAAGLSDVRVAVNGRDAALEGRATSAARSIEAERVAAGVAGVRRVDNRLVLRDLAGAGPAACLDAPATCLAISTRPGGVSLRGAVPSAAQRLEIVARARRQFGVEGVDEQLTVDATMAAGAAVAGASDVVAALAGADAGVTAQLEGDRLRLTGTVASAEARRRIEQQARAAVPGIRLFFSALAVDAGGAGVAAAADSPDEGS